MERDDVQLIDDILSGDDGAFNILIEKYQKSVTRARMAEDWGFPLCRGDNARHLSTRIQKTFNAQESESVCRVALCHCE